MKGFFVVMLLSLFGTTACRSQQKPTPYRYSKPSADGIGKYYMGREIAQVMGAGGIDWLERPERQSEENIDMAIAKMGLEPSYVVADIGAGSGYYTFRIAPQVPNGRVYAVDVQDEMIAYLENKKKQTGAGNVFVVKGDSMNIHLPKSSVDLAIMVDVYHELAWPEEMIRSVSESLKPNGKILLIEYRGEDPSVPIKPLHKTTIPQLRKELANNSFIVDYQGDFLPLQHFVMFRKAYKK